MEVVITVVWAVIVGWAIVATIAWRILAGPEGASPLAGSRVSWFSREHHAQIEALREVSLSRGHNLFWWRFFIIFVRYWPACIVIGVLATLALLWRAGVLRAP